MAKNSVVDEVRARIEALTAKKAAEMEIISSGLTKAQDRKRAAAAAAEAAYESMDLEALRQAEAEVSEAELAERLYSARLNQLRAQEMVTEEESDQVIGSLRGYLRDEERSFEISLGVILREMQTLYDSHIEDVRNAESAIRSWTTNVHKNYQSENSSFYDSKTGTYTHRAPYPVPVPTSDGQGGGTARMVNHFLVNMARLLVDPEEVTEE